MNLNEVIKNEILTKLAEEFAGCLKSARECKNHGYEQMAEQSRWQALGVSQAVEALGYTQEEFAPYVKEARKKLRNNE